MSPRKRCGELTVAATLLAAGTALAQSQPSDADLKAAQSLFDDARALMTAGKTAEACPKFADSLAIFRASGTLLDLALCHEETGRLASAYTEFDESLARARADRRPDREQTAQKHLQSIATKVSHLTVTVPPAAQVDGLVVTLDGAELHRPSWGVRTMVDGGDHVIEAQAPGRTTWRKTAKVAPTGDDQTIVVEAPPAGENVAAPPASASASATASAASAPPPSSAPPPPPPSSTTPPDDAGGRRTLAYVVGGLGVVGIGVGGVLVGAAASQWRGAAQDCPGDVCPTSAARDKHAGAGTLADGATIAFVAGGVALAAGAVLYFSAPRANVRVGAILGPGVAGLGVGGSL